MADFFLSYPPIGGVTTINGLSGAITLAAGANISITPSGTTLTISATGTLTSSLTNAHIFVGNVSNVATDVAVSGILTLANTGAFSYAAVPANTAVANFTGGSAVPTNTSLSATGGTSNFVMRSSAGNSSANNLTSAFTTTVTAAGTTTLTAASTRFQYFTGTTTQNVVLPDATTLQTGWQFEFKNQGTNPTGTLTIKNNGGTTLGTVLYGANTIYTCTSTSTANGTWNTYGVLIGSSQHNTTGLTINGTGVFFGNIGATNFSGSSSGTNTGDQLTFKTISTPDGGFDVIASSAADTVLFTTITDTMVIIGSNSPNQVDFNVPGALIHPNAECTYEYTYRPDFPPPGNTAIGYRSLQQDDYNNSSSSNSAFGAYSMYAMTNGTSSSSFGYYSLAALQSGAANASYGAYSGSTLTTANYISLFGHNAGYALEDSSDGSFFMGAYAGSGLRHNVGRNMAIGTNAFQSCTSDDATNNLAIGELALFTLDGSASGNTAIGKSSLQSISGSSTNNTAIGPNCLQSITASASHNTFTGGLNFPSASGGDFNYNSVFGTGNGYNIGSGTTTFTTIFGYDNVFVATDSSQVSVFGNNCLASISNPANMLCFGNNVLVAQNSGSHMIGIGDYAFQVSTASSYCIGLGTDSGSNLDNGYMSIALGHGSTFSSSGPSNEMCVGGPSGSGYTIGNYFFGNGGAPDGSPQDIFFFPTPATGNNVPGAKFNIHGGVGTGSGTPGGIFFKTAPALASGSTLQNQVTSAEINGAGQLKISRAGAGLSVAEGSNAKMGTAVLVAGTKVVSTTAVTANSRIFLTANTPGGTVGAVYVSARTAGTSFTITSLSVIDTSTVAWIIFEPS